MPTRTSKISQRKKDHLKIALSDKVQIGSTGLEMYRFVHNALPEINFEEIDTSTSFLGKKVGFPFFISCMTGGVEKGGILNKNLALAAQKMKIAMGVGSQRAAVEHPELVKSFEIRKYAPDVPIIANVGLVQLNYGFGFKELQKCVDMVGADALALHINPIQEVIQPEGDRNFEKLLTKLEKIIKKLKVPVFAKEVGFGLSYDVAKRLYDTGIKIFDTAGWGGTNWAMVEGLRGKADRHLGELFGNWGIPTAESILQVKKLKDQKKDKSIVILGSGGIRNGMEIAKSIAMGADLAGIAAPFAKAALISSEEVEKLAEKYAMELKTTMFGVGAKNVTELKKIHLTL
jgi:isopentenyl-diphosphate Delta-isomerase